MRGLLFAVSILTLVGCGQADNRAELTVAAAANLDRVLPRLAEAYGERSDVNIVVSYGATANLTQQIENGAPFDLFLAADTAHIDRLARSGRLDRATIRTYALGTLVLWADPKSGLACPTLDCLQDPAVRYIAIANPDFAPYGAAAVEALRQAGLWKRLEEKVVFGQNVRMAQQFAESGNADVAFTAKSLMPSRAVFLEIDAGLHAPIQQALGIVNGTPRSDAAAAFAEFLSEPASAAIWNEFGYRSPRAGAALQLVH